MKVYERLSLAFKAEGTTNVFGMMGDGNMYWQYGLASLSSRPLQSDLVHDCASVTRVD